MFLPQQSERDGANPSQSLIHSTRTYLRHLEGHHSALGPTRKLQPLCTPLVTHIALPRHECANAAHVGIEDHAVFPMLATKIDVSKLQQDHEEMDGIIHDIEQVCCSNSPSSLRFVHEIGALPPFVLMLQEDNLWHSNAVLCMVNRHAAVPME